MSDPIRSIRRPLRGTILTKIGKKYIRIMKINHRRASRQMVDEGVGLGLGQLRFSVVPPVSQHLVRLWRRDI